MRWTDGAYPTWASFGDMKPSGGNSSNCVNVAPYHNWQWMDFDCSEQMHFLCEDFSDSKRKA